MTDSWPSSLPQSPLAGDFVLENPELTVRSQVDVGPAKVRRRATAGVQVMTCTFRLDSTQRLTFLTFWRDTIKGGSLSYTWVSPVTNQIILCRIVDPPSFVTTDRGNHWNTTLKIEILP
jgi:hypothetical protein